MAALCYLALCDDILPYTYKEPKWLLSMMMDQGWPLEKLWWYLEYRSAVSMPSTVAAGTCYLCLPVAGSKLAPSFSFSQDIFPETSPRPGLFAYAASWSRASPSSGSPPAVEVGSHLSSILVSLCPCEFHTSRWVPLCLITTATFLPATLSNLQWLESEIRHRSNGFSQTSLHIV